MEDQPQVDDHLSILATVAVGPQRTCSTVSLTPPMYVKALHLLRYNLC